MHEISSNSQLNFIQYSESLEQNKEQEVLSITDIESLNDTKATPNGAKVKHDASLSGPAISEVGQLTFCQNILQLL